MTLSQYVLKNALAIIISEKLRVFKERADNLFCDKKRDEKLILK